MDDEEREEAIRRKILRMIAQRRALRMGAVALIALTLIFFVRGNYAVAIPLALGAVALAILSDWVIRPPEEL